MPATSVDLPPRYSDARHVANGGMAAVYAAEDAVLGRRVAVKVLAAHVAEDPASVHRFQREARAAARVSQHPHVVTIYDVGEHGGLPFIVMELMDGGSLARVLRAGPPARALALRWIAEAASALDAAHERDVVHRDVKPGNLLLDGAGRLGVADFGIARLAYETSVTLTGQVLGTAAYVAPEQVSGGDATAASDRYSLAVVAYELLTGARPYPGGTFAAQARQHVDAQPAPARSHVADLPAAVDGVLARGLAKDPGARWPSATAFAQALERAADEDATAVTRPLAAAAPAAPTPMPPASRAGAKRWLPVALVALLVGLVGVFALASGGGEEERRATGPPRETAEPRETTPAATAPAAQRPSVAQLNDQGFALMNQGRYGEAIPLLQQAVERCGDSRETVCAYALYNLGRALRLAGRPEEAIPILERRLTYGNQTGVVQAELDAARREAGAQTAPPGADHSREVEPEDDGKGRGKGKGKKGDD